MIRTILKMFVDVGIFLIFWFIVLGVLASVGALWWGGLPEYSKFVDVFFLMFETGGGNHNFEPFNELDHTEKEIGRWLLLVIVIVNAIVMLNFIIAILADTYAKWSSKKLGLYYDGVIARIPVYEDDSCYGGLVVGTPPFNILAVGLLPLYLCIKDENKLRSINDTFTKVVYLPIALIACSLFAAFTLAFIPFAYLFATYFKI